MTCRVDRSSKRLNGAGGILRLSELFGDRRGEVLTRETEYSFFQKGEIVMSITTLSLFKAQIKSNGVLDPSVFPDLDSSTDELLQHYLDTAEGWIEQFTGVVLADLTPFPATLKQAAMLLASYWVEQREAVSFGVSMDSVPFGVLDLIRPHREWTF